MEQVLTEKHHSPAMALPSGKPADERNATEATATEIRETERIDSPSLPASALLTSPDTIEPLSITELGIAEPPEPCTSIAVPTIAATAEASAGLMNADAAPTTEPRELERTEELDLFVPPVLTPLTPETGGLWSAPGTTARETWDPASPPAFDSAALKPVEETPPPAGALSPEQVHEAAPTSDKELPQAPFRKWPSSSFSTRTSRAEQNQDASLHNSSQEGLSELVPLKQYVHAQRSQLLRGAAIGVFLSLLIAISASKFWKPARQGETGNAPAVNSVIASGTTMPESAPPPSPMEASKSLGSSKEGPNAILPRKPSIGHADLAAPNQPSRSSGVASGDGVAAHDISNAPANAMPMPSSFAHRNSSAGSGAQPLFNLSQPGNSDGTTASTEPESGQPKVGVDLGSTPWSFHRRNIHGTPPVGGELHPAELISYVAPHYPEAAKARQISGEVVIDAVIDTRGNVRKPQVVSGPNLLRAAALNAVLEWKYKPALLDGKPTEVRETITVKFLP